MGAALKLDLAQICLVLARPAAGAAGRQTAKPSNPPPNSKSEAGSGIGSGPGSGNL